MNIANGVSKMCHARLFGRIETKIKRKSQARVAWPWGYSIMRLRNRCAQIRGAGAIFA
jgi:hypothetical protein